MRMEAIFIAEVAVIKDIYSLDYSHSNIVDV